MKIYQILENLYLGDIIEVDDSTEGIPIGWTRTSIEVPEGMYAIWESTHWGITDVPPPVIEPPQLPTKITTYAFFERLGASKFAIITSQIEEIKTFIQTITENGFVDLQAETTLSNLQIILNNGFYVDISGIVHTPIQLQEIYQPT